MIPTNQPLALTEGLSVETQATLTPSPHPPVVPSPEPVSGTTDPDVIPVVPAAGTQPENPVNEGIQARLPETPDAGTTDGITAKTFKLPTSTVLSIERAVARINEGLPANQEPWSVHRYGVDTLNNHEIARKCIAEAFEWAKDRENMRTSLALLQSQLGQEQHRVADLTAQLNQQRDYIARLEPQPTPTVAPPPTIAPTPEQELHWQQKYETNRAELAKALKRIDALKGETEDIVALVEALPGVVSAFCIEAARQSWYSPEYYQHFFHQLIAPYLPTE